MLLRFKSHFQNQFCRKNITPAAKPEPTDMKSPSTMKEIKLATKSLRNNKCEGSDGLKVELIKNCPDIIFSEIADIYNQTANTGKVPEEIISGIITAIQKPGKSRGPVSNLRPITILSMLRKILAICMKNRIIERIDEPIPPSQAAYRKKHNRTRFRHKAFG